MKKICFVAAIACLHTAAAQVKLPSPSPAQTISQEFALGKIEARYSRPAAKGRTVFGDLVPFGKLWRTGANEATRLYFSDPVEIEGKKIDSGTYALYSIPGEESWDIILNKGVDNWGIEGYQDSEDVIRFKTAPVKLKLPVENFTMQFSNITAESCQLQLMWEKKMISFSIRVNIISKLKAQLEAAMHTPSKPYWEAAQFYYEYETDLVKALENVNHALNENPTAFWMFLYKARIQKDMGNMTGALESSKISLRLAKEAGNEDYVRMNKKLQGELQ